MDNIYFINVFKSKTNNKDIDEKSKVDLVSQLIHPKRYLSFNQKKQMVIDILKDIVSEQNNKITYNSCDKYYKFICTIICKYTDIEFDDKMYDNLCENNVLQLVIASIGQEYDLCLGVMEMYMDDLEHNRISIGML